MLLAVDWASELALCRRSRGVGFFLDIECLAIGFVVRGGLCVFELLSARLAAADNDHHPESVGPGR